MHPVLYRNAICALCASLKLSGGCLGRDRQIVHAGVRFMRAHNLGQGRAVRFERACLCNRLRGTLVSWMGLRALGWGFAGIASELAS